MVLLGVWPLSTKNYGHWNHRLHFVGKELERQNSNVISGGRNDLIDSYTREEIKFEFILNCMNAKSKNKRTTEAHDIIAMSVLKFISKISGQSDMYTTPVFRSRLGLIQTQTTAFDEFIRAFRDGRYKDCLSTA